MADERAPEQHAAPESHASHRIDAVGDRGAADQAHQSQVTSQSGTPAAEPSTRCYSGTHAKNVGIAGVASVGLVLCSMVVAAVGITSRVDATVALLMIALSMALLLIRWFVFSRPHTRVVPLLSPHAVAVTALALSVGGLCTTACGQLDAYRMRLGFDPALVGLIVHAAALLSIIAHRLAHGMASQVHMLPADWRQSVLAVDRMGYSVASLLAGVAIGASLFFAVLLIESGVVCPSCYAVHGAMLVQAIAYMWSARQRLTNADTNAADEMHQVGAKMSLVMGVLVCCLLAVWYATRPPPMLIDTAQPIAIETLRSFHGVDPRDKSQLAQQLALKSMNESSPSPNHAHDAQQAFDAGKKFDREWLASELAKDAADIDRAARIISAYIYGLDKVLEEDQNWLEKYLETLRSHSTPGGKHSGHQAGDDRPDTDMQVKSAVRRAEGELAKEALHQAIARRQGSAGSGGKRAVEPPPPKPKAPTTAVSIQTINMWGDPGSPVVMDFVYDPHCPSCGWQFEHVAALADLVRAKQLAVRFHIIYPTQTGNGVKPDVEQTHQAVATIIIASQWWGAQSMLDTMTTYIKHRAALSSVEDVVRLIPQHLDRDALFEVIERHQPIIQKALVTAQSFYRSQESTGTPYIRMTNVTTGASRVFDGLHAESVLRLAHRSLLTSQFRP